MMKYCVLTAVALVASIPAGADSLREKDRERELVRLVRQDCGSCHGMTLQGGLGPALLPANLQNRTQLSVAATIYYGRPGTPMPPWKQFMTEAEANWIAAKLLEGFPEQ